MNNKITIKEMTLIGLAAALMGVFSQLAIPLPTVPLTLQVFGAILLSVILEAKLATFSMFIYTLVGMIGIPVFANFGRGMSVLVGPTGGYIFGFIALAFIIGKAAQQKNKYIVMLGAYIGLIIQYTIGTIQLKIVLDVTFAKAMAIGVYPFIIKDLILTALAVICAIQVKARLGSILPRRVQA